MAGIDAFAPAKALGLGLLLAGVNPRTSCWRPVPRASRR
jgi:hypothetical protein